MRHATYVTQDLPSRVYIALQLRPIARQRYAIGVYHCGLGYYLVDVISHTRDMLQVLLGC